MYGYNLVSVTYWSFAEMDLCCQELVVKMVAVINLSFFFMFPIRFSTRINRGGIMLERDRNHVFVECLKLGF